LRVLTIDRNIFVPLQKKSMIKIICKSCSSDKYVKNGTVRFQQRYKCKECGCSFIVGDKREKLSPAARSLAILLYGRGKASYGFIAKLLNVSSVAVMKLIKREADKMPEPEIDLSIKEVSFDEMWHFVERKKKNYGSGGQWSAVEIGQSDGVLGIVLLKHSEISTKNLSI
jgi:transposase